MSDGIEAIPVLIAGGGPVGLMTALELNYHGVDTILIERNETTTRHPKMDITNSRSMELFRRLGVAGILRSDAVPEDRPYSVTWIDSLMGSELARFDYPCVNDKRNQLRELNDGSLAGEPSMRISQIHLEPILKDFLETNCPHVDVRFGWALESLEQDGEGVTATIHNGKTDERKKIRADYLAGCDGAGSVARKSLNIPVNFINPEDFFVNGADPENYLDTARGEPPADANTHPLMFMIHFTVSGNACELLERFGKAWHLQSMTGWNLISQNDQNIWTAHFMADLVKDAASRDPKEVLFEILGCEFECEVQVANGWQPALGLADSYGHGRVWLAGDSVHQVIPTGGYGMNTGMGDATAIAWALAANVQGWGGAKLFEAYEIERRHVGARARIASARHAGIRFMIAEQYDPVIHENSEAGRVKREELGKFIIEAGNLENEADGIEWGYRYDASTVICHEDGEAPVYEWDHYKPSTWPGVRAPNVFLDGGTGASIYDLFGKGFTLLNFGDASSEAFASVAEERGLPLDIVRVNDAHAASLYQKPLVLIRPDQHVAWRGEGVPTAGEIKAIIDKVTGVAA